MCFCQCPLRGREVAITSVHRHGDSYHLKGQVTSTASSRNLAERYWYFFQRLELVEKIAEIVDETFHLFASTLKYYATPEVYQFFYNFHNGAHELEHGLHAICFLNDIVQLHNFCIYDEKGQMDLIRTAGKVFHFVSHFLFTISVLGELKLISLGVLKPFIKYKNVLGAIGYALWTLSLFYKKGSHNQNPESFSTDLGIHGGGFAFQALSWLESASTGSFQGLIGKAASVAGIIHAWSVSKRIMPADKETIPIEITFNESQIGREAKG